MAEPVSIVNLLSQFLVDVLSEYLITEPDESDIDPEWKNSAGLVRAGKLQANPLIGKINVLVREGGEDWPDVYAHKDNQDGIYVPETEIGGGGSMTTWFLRRFYVEMRIYLRTRDRLYAQQSKNIVQSRAFQALLSGQTHQKIRELAMDDFGETAHFVNIQESFMREGGGPGTFIWKGKIGCQFLTSFDA